MLFIAALSIAILVIFNLAVLLSRGPTVVVLLIAANFFLLFGLFEVIAQMILLTVSFAIWKAARWKPWVFVPLSCVATAASLALVTYGIVSHSARTGYPEAPRAGEVLLYTIGSTVVILVICNFAVFLSQELTDEQIKEAPVVFATGFAAIFFLCVLIASRAGVPQLMAVLQPVFLFIAFSIWNALRWKPWRFIPLSCAASAAALALTAFGILSDYARMREIVPFESLTERLPLPKPQLRPPSLRGAATDHLEQVEVSLDGAIFALVRTRFIKRLHETTVEIFINHPGFGVSRIPSTERDLKDVYSKPAPDQPGSPSPYAWSPGNPNASGTNLDEKDLYGAHQKGVIDFVFSYGWGFAKDRNNVAGFQSHRFSEVPEAKAWKVQTLDLVSLLLHDEPVVYVSKRLPRMGDVRDAPTRPLDAFEASGLAALRDGEDLFVAEVTDGLRMLGAVRAVKQCLGCHGGERGDLLGAFSYSLRGAEN
jgi:hypothetical protein